MSAETTIDISRSTKVFVNLIAWGIFAHVFCWLYAHVTLHLDLWLRLEFSGWVAASGFLFMMVGMTDLRWKHQRTYEGVMLYVGSMMVAISAIIVPLSYALL